MGELTSSQIAAIRKTWDMVRPNYKAVGAEFFVYFFSQHPDYKGKFANLQGISDGQLQGSSQLKGHGVRVLSALGSYVDNLDDHAVLEDLLKKNGRDHVPRGLTSQHYTNLFNCLVSFLEQKLGGAFDGSAKSAWKAAAGVMVPLLSSGLHG